MRPETGEVLHFSEDPSITRFVPHVAPTAADATAYVWAVDAAHAPGYWFPRQCPPATAWVAEDTVDADRERVLGPHATRVPTIEYAWLARVQTAQLFAHRVEVAQFEPYGDTRDPHAFVARHPVVPLGPPEPVGDLLALHVAARDRGPARLLALAVVGGRDRFHRRLQRCPPAERSRGVDLTGGRPGPSGARASRWAVRVAEVPRRRASHRPRRRVSSAA